MKERIEEGIRKLRFLITTYETPNEISALITENYDFHDGEIVGIEYDGKSHAHISVNFNNESYQFIFDNVNLFTIYADPKTLYLDSIIVSFDNDMIQAAFLATNIRITAENLVVVTAKKNENQE